MADHEEEAAAEVERLASGMAARLAGDAPSFAAASRECEAEYLELRRAVARLDARFAFDADGRPAAIEAVRAALPEVERELFDAILEDHACEIAAVEEALYRVGRASRRES